MRCPLLVLSFTQAHQCDTPFCNISRDNCAIPHKNKHERVLRYYRYEYRAIKYRSWASKFISSCFGSENGVFWKMGLCKKERVYRVTRVWKISRDSSSENTPLLVLTFEENLQQNPMICLQLKSLTHLCRLVGPTTLNTLSALIKEMKAFLHN